MQSTQTPYLPFSEYSFTYQAIDSIKTPPFPTLLLHGAFGNALHQNTCVLPERERYDKKCADCGIKNDCAYPYIFKRQYLTQSNNLSQQANSSPYVFRFQHQSHLRVPAKHYFDLDLVIFGHANERVDYFIHAMKSLGELGISQRQAQLVGIQQKLQTGLPVSISHAGSHQAASQPELPAMPDQVIIQFVTPYVLRDEKMLQAFDISYWLMAVIRRISRLQYTFTNQPSEADFSYLKNLTQLAHVDKPELYFYETPHTRKTHCSGVLGSISLSLEGIEELWPWLYLGQWFHVGKKTSNGNGRYQLVIEEQ